MVAKCNRYHFEYSAKDLVSRVAAGGRAPRRNSNGPASTSAGRPPSRHPSLLVVIDMVSGLLSQALGLGVRAAGCSRQPVQPRDLI